MRLKTRADNILNAIRPILSMQQKKEGIDAMFTFKEDTIETTVVDVAHVCMMRVWTDMHASLKEGGTQEYTIEGEKEVYAIDTLRLARALKSIGTDIVTLYTEGEWLYAETDTMKASMSLVDTSRMHKPQIPRVTFIGYFDTSITLLKKRFKQLGIVSDTIQVLYDNGRITYKAKDEFNGSMEYFEYVPCISKNDVSARSKFPHNYLTRAVTNMFPTAESGYKVKVSIGNDAPICMEYTRGNTDILYMLAPRVDDRW